MEEILKLQQQLAAIQNATTKTKLADRNVIEIINLLTSKYALELHFSTDGKQECDFSKEMSSLLRSNWTK